MFYLRYHILSLSKPLWLLTLYNHLLCPVCMSVCLHDMLYFTSSLIQSHHTTPHLLSSLFVLLSVLLSVLLCLCRSIHGSCVDMHVEGCWCDVRAVRSLRTQNYLPGMYVRSHELESAQLIVRRTSGQ